MSINFNPDNIRSFVDSSGRLTSRFTSPSLNLPDVNIPGFPKQLASYSTIGASQRIGSFSADPTTELLQNNQKTNEGSTLFYPDEINGQNSDQIRNIIKLSIFEFKGAQLSQETESLKNNLDEASRRALAGTQDVIDGVRNFINAAKGGSTFYSQGIIENTITRKPRATTNLSKVSNGQLIQDIATQIGTQVNIDQQLELLPRQSIWLYMPDNIGASYNMDYQDSDLTSPEKLIDVIKGVLGPNPAENPGLQSVLTQLGIDLVNDGLGGQNGLNFKELIEARTRRIPTYNFEYLFKKVQRRSFDYNFKFYPKSENEITNVQYILRSLRYYSHPERQKETRFLNMPAVFKIGYYYFDGKTYKENLYLNRIKPCVLKSLDIDYTNSYGKFNTLKSTDDTNPNYTFKSPVGMEVKLKFDELQLLTRDDLTDPNIDTIEQGRLYH